MAKKVAPAPTSEEREKIKTAAQMQQRRAQKKQKGNLKFYIAIGSVIACTVLACILAFMGDPPKKGAPTKSEQLVNDKSFIKYTTADSAGNFTAAASPFFDKWTYGDVKNGLDGIGLHGANMIGMPGALQTCEIDTDTESGAMPFTYDVREQAPGCIGDVYDSGNCSSSYAIAAATSLASRFCIDDNQKYANLRLSAQQILSCDKKSKGCRGGGVDSVWSYIQDRGLYPEKCVPFANGKQAACKTDCDQSEKLKAMSHCVMSGEKNIKREIYNRGPVVAPLYVHDDFLVYQGGVYSPTERSKPQYGADGRTILQVVTIIGWGKSQGLKYWLVANSWGKGWGEEGYARVAVNTVLLENYALVSFPATQEALALAEKKKSS